MVLFSLNFEKCIRNMSTKRKASAVVLSEREWFTNIHRDSYASHIGHKDMLTYFAIAQNQHIERVRYDMLEKMLQPCGSSQQPPQKKL